MTLEDDVARRIERLRAERRATFKAVVNQALREGIASMEAPTEPRQPFHTKEVDHGRLLVNVDSIGDALAAAEGDRHG